MQVRITWIGTVATIMLLCIGGLLNGAEPSQTVITVEGMHCPMCAKRIVAKLKAIKGVAEVQADVESQVVAVAPINRHTPSPRAMWEAVEGSGFKPVKLTCPSGVFTSKPRR